MILYLTVPTSSGMIHQSIYALVEQARAQFKARGWTLIFDPVQDRPTMACRNASVNRCLRTPATVFLTIDSDAVVDLEGLMELCETIRRDDVDIVAGWSLIHRESHGDIVPCVVKPRGADPEQPDRWPLDLVSPYAEEPVEITGGAVGTHAVMVKRRVFEAMKSTGRLYFEDIHYRDPAHRDFGGRDQGHDLMFCKAAADLGFRLWLHPGVFWGHRKDVDLRWVHDLARNMAAKVNAHAAVAQLLRETPDDPPAWMILRVAEEAAGIWRDGGAAVASPGVLLRLLRVFLGERAMTPQQVNGQAVGLVALRKGEPWPGCVRGEPCTLVMEETEQETVNAFIEMGSNPEWESVGRGAVVTCG